jgi:hypothetical protein
MGRRKSEILSKGPGKAGHAEPQHHDENAAKNMKASGLGTGLQPINMQP